MSDNLKRPTRCGQGASFSPCEGRKFKLVRDDGDPYFECVSCGWKHHAHQRQATALVLAKCQRCEEPFLWKDQASESYQRETPKYCGACGLIFQALHYERSAKKLRGQSVERRESQRRGVARHKLDIRDQ